MLTRIASLKLTDKGWSLNMGSIFSILNVEKNITFTHENSHIR